jgi:uncharacterized protein (DUF1499 family)
MLRRLPFSGGTALQGSSRAANASAGIGLVGVACFALGPAAIQIGLASPLLGFRIFLLGTLLGLLAVVLGVLGLWLSRPVSGGEGRGRATVGLGLGFTLVAITAIAALSAGRVPTINDISTDLENPPVFPEAASLAADAGRDLSYPGEVFARQQRAGYPDLAPIRLQRSPTQTFRDARRVATELGWEVIREDAEGGILQAIDVTRIFRFVDDIVIRIRPEQAGCVVDLRSRSREGRGDLGANADRIRAFRDRIGD